MPDDARYHEKIFGLFQRAVGRDIPGTGAGLAIVRQIAARHGGDAWVEGREGGGARFFITFTRPEPSGAPQGSCVDANRENVARTRQWLEDNGDLDPDELAKFDQWTWRYLDDVLFPTGPEFIGDDSVVFLARPASGPSLFRVIDGIR